MDLKTTMKTSPLGYRLKLAIESSGVRSMRAFALSAGVSQSLPGQLVRGDVQSADAETLAAYARAARVDLGWLSTGEGQPRPGESQRRFVELDESPRAGLMREAPEFRMFARGELRRAGEDSREETEEALDYAALVLPRHRGQGGERVFLGTQQMRAAFEEGRAIYRGEEPPTRHARGVDALQASPVGTMAERSAKLQREKPR